MNYIKAYSELQELRREDPLRWEEIRQENEKRDRMVVYLNDILQELIDSGFKCKYMSNDHMIIVSIMGPRRASFNYNEVEDYIDSATDYMKSNDYKLASLKEWVTGSHEWSIIKRPDSEIQSELKIIYAK